MPPAPRPTTIHISDRLTSLQEMAALHGQGGDMVGEAGGRRSSAWSEFWRVSDRALRDAGLQGERTIAKYRLMAALLLCGIALRAVMTSYDLRETWVGLGIGLVGALACVFFLWLTHQDRVRSWIGFVASLLDVTLVSAGLALFVALDLPQIATNSRVIFEVYFICLAVTCLRYDRRICLVTGLTAAAQYALIVWWASTTIGISPTWNDGSYGRFDVQDQIARIVLLLVATIVSLSIVLRVQQLRVLSVRDRLTGLMIRGYFDERIGEAFDSARRTGEPIAVAMIDLDYFKSFNDRFGHAVGDMVLSSVAGAIKQLVRDEDVVGRYGGEELIVMLPGLDRAKASERMELIRLAISEVGVELDGHAGRRAADHAQAELFTDIPADYVRTVLTASIGVASWPEDNMDTVAALVCRADARLLKAKSSGRNRVESNADGFDEFAVIASYQAADGAASHAG